MLWIDSDCALLHDTATMPSQELESAVSDNKRRSSRVFTRIPVRAKGVSVQGRKFNETSQTIVVNAHGGLIYLNERIEMDAQILLINPASEEEQECRVVYLGDASEKGQRVGVEFLSPAPNFWGVDFAPVDWPGRTPSTLPPS